MSKPKLLNLLKNNNIIDIIIPAGRMMGDVDGDGLITEDDVTIIYNHITETELITDATQLLVADINNDGKISAVDRKIVSNIKGGTAFIGAYGEITGNWTVNPNYATEEMQFYTDISISDMTVSSSATITIKGASEHNNFRAECLDGAIRIYVNLCPISELKAIVQYGAGNGTAIVVCEDTNLANVTRIATVTIPSGIMYGDVDFDGLITENDTEIINNHNKGIELITNSVKLEIADVNKDGNINVSDVVIVSRIANNNTKAGALGVYNGNWVVNSNYETEEMQFYTDIAISDMTASSSATISLNGIYSNNSFDAECLDGAIRIYAKLCPINNIKAVVQYGYGDGSAIVVYENIETNIILNTLLASSWTDNTYSFESTYPVDSYDIEISVDSSATEEQLTAFSDALICGSYNSNVITAKGTVPTLNIPIIIKVVKK